MTSVLYSRGRTAHFSQTRSLQARFVLSALSLSLFAVNDVHAQWRTKPAVQISFPNYSYSRALTSLRALELGNSLVVFFDNKGAPDFRAALHAGTYEKRDKSGGESAKFSWLTTLGNDSMDPDFAIAYYSWVTSAASANDFGVIQLLDLEDGRLKVVQQILFNTRAARKRAPSSAASQEY